MRVDKNSLYEGNTCQRVFPIFNQYREELVRYVNQRIGDELQSKALVSDVLIKLHQHCEKLDEIKNIRAWLFQVTRRTLYDYFREHSKQSFTSMETVEAKDYEGVQTELASLVSVLIECLPEKYAFPLRMSDLEGVSQHLIADQLNLSHSGAKSRIQRARKLLKEMFHQCLHLELDQHGIPVDYQVKPGCELNLEATKEEGCSHTSGMPNECNC